MCRFLFQADGLTLRVKLDYAVSLGIVNGVRKNQGAAPQSGGGLKQFGQPMPEKDVIAQDQAGWFPRDKVGADTKRIRQTSRLVLLGISESQPPAIPVPQQMPEQGQILGRADDQDLTYARQHQDRKRIIDHGFVVDRQELFADRQCQRIQPRAAPASKNDAFHDCFSRFL